MQRFLSALALVAGLAVSAPADAQQMYTPRVGSAERQAIMDALRVSTRSSFARSGIRSSYVFKVSTLNVQGTWAYITAVPVTADGRRLPLQEPEEGCGTYGQAILRRTGTQWRVVEDNHNGCDPMVPEQMARLGGPVRLIPVAESDPVPMADFEGTAAAILRGDRLSADQIHNFSVPELELLRNTVYARHGRPFSRADLRRHFASRSWYRMRSDYSDARLSAADRANIALITRHEGR